MTDLERRGSDTRLQGAGSQVAEGCAEFVQVSALSPEAVATPTVEGKSKATSAKAGNPNIKTVKSPPSFAPQISHLNFEGLYSLLGNLTRKASGTPLCRFRQYLLGARRAAPVASVTRSLVEAPYNRLVPMHLPPPPAMGARPTRSRDLLAWRQKQGAWMMTEWLISGFSFWETGCPKHNYEALMGPYNITDDQIKVSRDLFEGLLAVCRASPEGVGRGRESFLEALGRLSSEADVGEPVDGNVTCAKEVVCDRVSMPVVAGVCDPVKHMQHLCPQEASVLKHLEQLVEPESCWPAVLPRQCHMISEAEEAKLRLKLHLSGMAVLIAEDDVPVDSKGRKLLAGLFCVAHKLDKDRLIFDRRPQNATERRLGWCRLPHGCQFGDLLLRPQETLRGSGDDLSNYFYQLLHAENWWRRNSFGRVFSGREAAALGGDPSKRYHMCLRVVAMGDHNAVDVAQKLHETILKNHNCMLESDVLRYGSPIPPSDVLEGAYIDDHLVVGRVGRHAVKGPGRDREVLSRSRAAYVASGLPLSAKSFNECGTFNAWGIEVRAEQGEVGVARGKLLQIMTLGLATAAGGVATKQVMQQLLGLMIHPFCLRRELMSSFQRAYVWTASLDEGVVVKIPADIRDELIMGSMLLSQAHGNIRAPVSTMISCSDATPSRGGVVRSRVSREMAEGLYWCGDRRGRPVRLGEVLGEQGTDEAATPENMLKKSQLKGVLTDELGTALGGCQWEVSHSAEFASSAHVNIQELKAARVALMQAVSDSLEPQRVINGTDSQVILGAVAKGRSASYKLNSVMRSMLAWQVLGKKRLVQFYVPTKDNPSDDPSRDVPLRQPCPLHPKLRRLVTPEGSALGLSSKASRLEQQLCLELFAGKGGLSSALRAAHVPCMRPVELYDRSKKIIPEHDLSNEAVVSRLISDCKRGCYRYVHLGTPCNSWSTLQSLNDGTRTQARPEGDGCQYREVLGNLLAVNSIRIAHAQIDSGNYFSIENPKSSMLWKFEPMLDLMSRSFLVDFDQCSYGLCLESMVKDPRRAFPNPRGQNTVKKPTSLLTNMEALKSLERTCSCSSKHVPRMGGVSTKHGYKKLSALAGAYPQPLCRKWALAVAGALARAGC